MPPVNQGSRTALITWTVVPSFFFVPATIFAIYFYVEASRVNLLNEERRTKYADIVAEGALTSPDVGALRELKSNEKAGYTPSMTALDVSIKRSDNLAKTIAGATAAN